MCGILYSPVAASLSVRCCERGRHVHRRVPAHVGHVHEQHVDGVGIAASPRWRSPCASGRGRRAARPRNRPCRCAAACPSASTSRSSGPARKPSGGPGSGVFGLTSPGLPRGLDGGRRRLRERRLVAEAARAIDRAEQDLQEVQRCGRSGSRWNGRRCRAWRASRPGGRSSSRGGGRPSRSTECRARSAARRRHAPARRRCGGWWRRECRSVPPPLPAHSRRRGSARRSAGRRHARAAVGQREACP